MKKLGFTVAEVLITMGIIGIISALTLPTFVTDYRKQMYSKSLVSAVADFENAMMIMMKKEGIDDLFYSEAWTAIRDANAFLLSANSNDDVIENFMGKITKILPIESYKTDEWEFYPLDGKTELSEDRLVRFKTKQGVVYGITIRQPFSQEPIDEKIALMNNSEYRNQAARLVVIDINGENMPNREGRDIFYYELFTDGHLYRYGSKEQCLYSNNTYHDPRRFCVEGRQGEYCAAYLRTNNYQMDY